METRSLTSCLALGALMSLSACNQVGPGQDDVHLPEGDAVRGEEHFVSLGCTSCHTVFGAELPKPAEAGPVRVRLGSKTSRKMTYGQLVTSVVNPSHRLSPRYRADAVSEDGQSMMTSINDTLTVTQLTDLVAFLQAHYQVADRPGYKYPVYDYRSDDESEDSESQ